MAHLIANDQRFQRFPALNQAFIQTIPTLDDAGLHGLLYHAKVIFLPITAGGGTNLKTAEAFLTLKPVVAMRPALRGYQEAEDLSGVYVADTPNQFRAFLRQTMIGTLTSQRTPKDVQLYAWPAQLAPLIDFYST